MVYLFKNVTTHQKSFQQIQEMKEQEGETGNESETVRFGGKNGMWPVRRNNPWSVMKKIL